MISIARIDAWAIRVPIEEPIKVAFGTFRDRPMVLVRVTDSDGAEGWGEAWSNWPAVGAEHRARLAVDLGQMLIGRDFDKPGDIFAEMTSKTEVLVLQTGEVGPIAQAIAGIDIAVWDLHARKRGLPLYRCLKDERVERVPVYASGINPEGSAEYAAARLAEGHRAFKLKIGFGRDLDLANIVAVREVIGPDCEFMIDANQALTLDAALDIADAAAGYGLRWLEEPMRVDAPADDWRTLAERSAIPLAGGENVRGDEFDAWIAAGNLAVFQPDITKWGGVTGCYDVGQKARSAGRTYCPHVFGGALASLASLHVLAAVGGDGLLETDSHPNAGRQAIIKDLLPVSDGTVPVPQGAGLGADVDMSAFRDLVTWTSANSNF